MADDILPPSVNFTIPLAEKVRAQEGLPAHLQRLGAIERLMERMLGELRGAGDPRKMETDLKRVNDLIDRHNRYYPIEANLPIDRRTGGSRGFRPLEPVTVELLRERLNSTNR
jgi:hypothetical protein